MVAVTYRSEVTLIGTSHPSRIGYSMGGGLSASKWAKSTLSNERDLALGATLMLQELVAEYQSQCLKSDNMPESSNNCVYLRSRIKGTMGQIGHKLSCQPPGLPRDTLSAETLAALADCAERKKQALDNVATTIFTLGTRCVYTDVENVKLGRLVFRLGVGFLMLEEVRNDTLGY